MTETDKRHVQAFTELLENEPLPDSQVVSGAPAVRTAALGAMADVAYGIWEITPGVVEDVEADEVFVVLSGRARVEILDHGTVMDISAGDVVRLFAGERTVWTVTETLRKVYVAL